jgi:hypothetical protein
VIGHVLQGCAGGCKCLDEAVFAAYGWPLNLTDEEVLQNLLALNLARSEEAR